MPDPRSDPRPAPDPGATGAEGSPAPDVDVGSLRGFQRQIDALYGARDRDRGVEGTFVWFVEEVGELARALKGSDRANLEEEFADVLAWLVTLASLEGIEVADAARKYAPACPRCGEIPCDCPRKSAQRHA